MNSENSLKLNVILQESTAASSNISTSSDSNANVSGEVDRSKGAIPKTKPQPKHPDTIPKRSVKLNNNIEDMSVLYGVNSSKDVLKLNGYMNGSIECNSYLDKFQKNNHLENLETISTTEVNISKSTEHINSLLLETDYSTMPSESSSIPIDDFSFQPSPSSFNRMRLKFDSDSSSEDNELLSVSDDGCIYTYKGDQVADLPSSFFKLEMPLVENQEPIENLTRNSSPEMDFLEMDFDPGPSGDADSDSNSNGEVENLPEDDNQDIYKTDTVNFKQDVNKSKNITDNKINKNSLDKVDVKKITSALFDCTISGPSTSYNNSLKQNVIKKTSKSEPSKLNIEIKMPWSCTLTQRTTSSSSPRFAKRLHCSSGDLISPSEKDVSPASEHTISSMVASFYSCPEGALLTDTSLSPDCEGKIMIWSQQEACVKQITQIGASACGATAVLNVLTALRFPIPSIEKIQEAVTTRLRANNSPLTEYLLSRSVAGSTHKDLISGLQKISNGQIYARFFAMYPERIVNLYMWLGFWIQNGAVPIATLNLQKCSGTIPDAWHHQMIFGVGPNDVYLTNPLECVNSGQLWTQLCSESVLLIKREDVLSRWNIRTDLKRLMAIQDSKWRRINVVGQVANMVRESMREFRPGFANTSHIKIPAAYTSGITLAININSAAYTLLSQCPELPLLHPNDTASALYSKVKMNK